jgi:hypothetical protein
MKWIQDGLGIEAPNAPTLVEMEVETQLLGGSERIQLTGGSLDVVVKVQPIVKWKRHNLLVEVKNFFHCNQTLDQ